MTHLCIDKHFYLTVWLLFLPAWINSQSILDVTLQFPMGSYGGKIGERKLSTIALPGEIISGILQIDSKETSPVVARVVISSNSGTSKINGVKSRVEFSPGFPKDFFQTIQGNLIGDRRFNFVGDSELVQFSVTVPEQTGDFNFDVSVGCVPEAQGDREQMHLMKDQEQRVFYQSVVLHVQSMDTIREKVKITRVVFPCDSDGKPLKGRLANAVVFPGGFWKGVSRVLAPGVLEPNYYAPIAFQGIVITNTLPHYMTVKVKAGEVSESGSKASGSIRRLFAGDWWQDKPRIFTQQGIMTLSPHGEQAALLPFFISPQTPAGEFEQTLQLQFMGSDRILQSEKFQFVVIRQYGSVVIFLTGLTIVLIICIFFVPRFIARLMERLYVRQLVLIALFGSLIVAGVFFINFINMPLQGLLGPFNIFIGGGFYKILIVALWICLLTLLPYVGVVTLCTLVSYMLGGVVYGAFNPLDLILVGSGILYKEFFLKIWGCTHLLTTREFDTQREVPFSRILRMAIALALADALSTYTSLALQMIFYRLYFAQWYLWAAVIFESFGYTILGGLLSINLARMIHRISAPSL